MTEKYKWVAAGQYKTQREKELYMSFFPVKIKYEDTCDVVIVKKPEDIQSGRMFTVLAVRVS